MQRLLHLRQPVPWLGRAGPARRELSEFVSVVSSPEISSQTASSQYMSSVLFAEEEQGDKHLYHVNLYYYTLYFNIVKQQFHRANLNKLQLGYTIIFWPKVLINIVMKLTGFSKISITIWLLYPR